MNHPPGTAPVKQEFLLAAKSAQPLPDDDAAEGKTAHTQKDARDMRDEQNGGPSRRKMTKEEKKAQRGANKGRRFAKVKDEFDLCFSVGNGKICEHGSQCKFSHDIAVYLAAKPKDLPALQSISLFSEPPFVSYPEPSQETPLAASIDPQTICTVFNESGECRFGYKCRYLGNHIRKDDSGELQLVIDEEKKSKSAVAHTELNYVGNIVQKQLKSRKYPTPIADEYVKEVQERGNDEAKPKNATLPEELTVVQEPEQGGAVAVDEDTPMEDAAVSSKGVDALVEKRTGDSSSTAQNDAPDVATRFSEKKRLHWTGKTYLAPLTTVGNLPFRRLCVKYGADITCGEMGLALSFLQGSREEWSLVRRHPSESIFGVQVAGNKPATLVPTAEVLAKECGGGIDFVDVNCGCPIDLVFKQGSGSALLDAPGKLGKILIGMNKALGEIPVTVKIRTGVKDGKNNAHKLMPRAAAEWGASCITLHGRTRQQRYTRLADWDYIRECVEAVRAKEADEDLPPVPIFGGGDVFSSQDYWEKMDKSKVDGIMIGRGALIKPWIFTEIKERREWDISSRERLDHIRSYAEFGLSHFGTDTAGINTTRRYLCEALSFQYRYVPIGLLETLPGRINDRAPAFRGRDDLETLLSSPDSNDWVKISEMFLGPAPDNWSFTPKHKSNAYGSEEGQG